jgi:hypothetical protein
MKCIYAESLQKLRTTLNLSSGCFKKLSSGEMCHEEGERDDNRSQWVPMDADLRWHGMVKTLLRNGTEIACEQPRDR